MLFATSAVIALLPFVAAQTFTACDPTKKTCPADPGFESATTTFNFQSQGPDAEWDVIGTGSKISQDSNGLHFTIDAAGQAPTLGTKRYLFFGRVTATLQASTGAGIVSAFILQSDDLDEIDWEWLGGDTAHVQSNYFSKGNTSSYDRGGVHNVDNPQTTMHTYAIDWSPTQIEWIIDGTTVRTLAASSVGDQYPQTPMQVRIGTWCGGCPGVAEGTQQWAGGPTTFDGAPYIMTITNLEIDNTNPAGSYVYGDMSGSAASIQLGGDIPLPSGNSSSSNTASVTSSASQSSAASSSASESSAASSGSATSQASSPTGSSNSSPNNGGSGQNTIVTGPTSNNLPSQSSTGTKLAISGIAAMVIGAVALLA